MGHSWIQLVPPPPPPPPPPPHSRAHTAQRPAAKQSDARADGEFGSVVERRARTRRRGKKTIKSVAEASRPARVPPRVSCFPFRTPRPMHAYLAAAAATQPDLHAWWFFPLAGGRRARHLQNEKEKKRGEGVASPRMRAERHTRESASRHKRAISEHGGWEAGGLPVLTGGALGRHQPEKIWRLRPYAGLHSYPKPALAEPRPVPHTFVCGTGFPAGLVPGFPAGLFWMGGRTSSTSSSSPPAVSPHHWSSLNRRSAARAAACARRRIDRIGVSRIA